MFADGIVGRQTWNAMLNFEAETEDTFIEEESDFESETDLDLGVE